MMTLPWRLKPRFELGRAFQQLRASETGTADERIGELIRSPAVWGAPATSAFSKSPHILQAIHCCQKSLVCLVMFSLDALQNETLRAQRWNMVEVPVGLIVAGPQFRFLQLGRFAVLALLSSAFAPQGLQAACVAAFATFAGSSTRIFSLLTCVTLAA